MPATHHSSVDLPLSGVRIVDAVDGRLQTVGRILADLGASVVRLEDPSGSPARDRGVMHNGESVTFAVRNANKSSAIADSATTSGRAALAQLVADADIVLTDWSNERLDDAGLSPEILALQLPRLVFVSLSDFGRTGAKAGWTGSADVLFALSTVLSRSGLPDVTEPLLPPEFLAYEAAAAQAAWVTMLAYYNALRHESGDTVDFSSLEGLIQILDPALGVGGSARAGASMKDLPRGRPDSRHLYPIFPASDGYVRLCILAPRQWQGMFEWLGRPEEFADDKFNNIGQRFAAAGTLYPMIGRMLATLTRDEATELGQQYGVPTAALLDASEVMDTPAYAASGTFTTSSLPGGDAITVPAGLFDIDDERVGYRTAAPSLGNFTGHSDARPQFTLSAGGALPFDGLRVLDLGVIVVGAELGRLFADYGADVIKIESSSFPDGSRQSYSGEEMTEGTAWGQRNKRSLGLNLRHDEGKRLFAQLIAQADVILTNFKPGTLASLGFDWDTLQQLNPRIILSESSAFGNHGPWSKRMGYGPLVRASAGMSQLWRYPDIEASFSDAITIFPDHVVARLNAVAITALLLRRARTGRGGRVNTAQVDAIFSGMADSFALESVAPGSIRAEGSDRGVDAPRGIFRAAGDDEWVVVDTLGNDQFTALATVVGREDWIAAYPTAAARLSGAQELRDDLERWTSDRSPLEIAEKLQEAGVAAANMARVDDMLADEHLSSRGAFGEQRQRQLPIPLPANLAEARMRSVVGPRLGQAPLQSENTTKILIETLALPASEIDRLLEIGAIEEHPSARVGDRSLQTV